MPAERTLECDLKTEVNFVPRGADFEMRLENQSRLELPHGADFTCDYSSRLCATQGGLKMQKTKSTFRNAKANKKSEKTNIFAARAGLRLRPKSACATGVGLGATVSVDLCHRSRLKYLSHGFQTQGAIAARAGLKVRPKSTSVPRPWISNPRYEARVLRVLGPMVQRVKTTCS
jgi:hypothetical protein